jgi:hypothetical protein
MAVEMRLSGPMFDGRAEAILNRMADDCLRDLGDAVEESWQAYMDASFRVSTGYYQSHINIAKRGRDLVVNDAGVIYGHWLEGTGSRNFPVTRFKGYASARRAEQHIQREATAICEPAVRRAVEEINHG